ncbi:hypothetical protein BHE74_00035915 [Ensete ventricosum]|nr:hypothetical protein BHE74_00035915 [Ensete ventricosum]RZR97978.1 hypothetical protein BHM03_00027271 [Ensete ventricosum]
MVSVQPKKSDLFFYAWNSGGKNFMQIMEAELCSARALFPSREVSGDEELSVLPRHTKVIVTGNNRTKSVLVGLQGVVKKAVGLGGWHWLVRLCLPEVRTKTCTVISLPNDLVCTARLEFHKPTKPRQLDEMQVIVGFIHAAKRLKTLYP